MNTQTTTQDTFVQPRCYLSRDGNYLILVLPGNQVIRKHVNYFKQILQVPYERVPRKAGPQ